MHDLLGGVAGAMPGAPLLRQGGDRGVDHGQLVGTGVGRRVAGPQQPGQGLAAGVGKHSMGWKP